MQSVANYPENMDVLEPAALVAVDGVELEVESLSVSRELPSNMPDQVAAGSGINAATGSVSWVVGADLRKRSSHPWDGNSFPPKPADPVIAYMGYGAKMVRQLTGKVDSSQGSVADGDVSSKLVDLIDKLDQPVSFPAMLATMPPIDEGGNFRPVNCTPTFITDRILRACGFNATPPIQPGSVVSAPLMGSAWPDRGTLLTAGQRDFSSFPPSFVRSRWGQACDSILATYAPDLSRLGGVGRLDRVLQITMKVRTGSAESGSGYVQAEWPSGGYLRLQVNDSRSVIVEAHNGSTATTVCGISASPAATAEVFTLRISAAGSVTIYADNGATASGAWNIPSSMSGQNMSLVRVLSPHKTGHSFGGVQVNFSATTVYREPETARLTPAANQYQLPAFPRIEGRRALDVLKEQAEAECAAMWIDEEGVFRWVNRIALADADPVATLTALDDVIDVGWESSASGVRSKVVITSREAAISRSDVSNQLAWQGGSQSMEVGDVKQEIVTPDADTDWVDVDNTVGTVGIAGSSLWPSNFNRGHGSWAGGIQTDDDSEVWAFTNNSLFSVDVEKIADSVYKFTTTAGNPMPGYTVELRTPGEDIDTVVRSSKRNFNLPVLRAKAIIEWADRTTTGASTGPPESAVLEHDVGPWVQDLDAVQQLADWLSFEVSAPRPVLRDLSVIPDFRRQLGDVVWIEDPENMRIEMAVLITSITTEVSAGSASQTIGGRILQVEPYGATNAQLDAHAGGYTNTGFDTLWSDATNAQFDSNPLGRG